MGKEILIVDDSWTTLILLEWFFIDSGYTPVIVEDVEKALEYLKVNIPDLILLDLQLPKVSGFEFLKILTHKKVNIPVLVISANDSNESVKQAHALGAVGFVAKPFRLHDLLSKVSELLIIK